MSGKLNAVRGSTHNTSATDNNDAKDPTLDLVRHHLRLGYVDELNDVTLESVTRENMPSVIDPYTQLKGCEVEEQNARNISFFERFGFKLQRVPLFEPGGKDSPRHGLTVGVVANGRAGSRAGLKVGDRVLSMCASRVPDGEMKVGSATHFERRVNASEHEICPVVVQRGSQRLTLNVLPRASELFADGNAYFEKWYDTTLGFVRLKSFAFGATAWMQDTWREEDLKCLDALVIDLRGNPGGLIDEGLKMIDLFAEKGLVARTQKRGGDVRNHYAHPNAFKIPFCAKEKGNVFNSRGSVGPKKKRIWLLVDSRSASAAELFADALKVSIGATLVGEPMFGKRLMQTHIPIPIQNRTMSQTKVNNRPSKIARTLRHCTLVMSTGRFQTLRDSAFKQRRNITRRRHPQESPRTTRQGSLRRDVSGKNEAGEWVEGKMNAGFKSHDRRFGVGRGGSVSACLNALLKTYPSAPIPRQSIKGCIITKSKTSVSQRTLR